MDASFATLLRRYRVAAGLTQEELAERSSISRRSVSDMERGVPHRPRKDTIFLLADALDLSATERLTLVETAERLHASPSLPASAQFQPLTYVQATPGFMGRIREMGVIERHLQKQGSPLLLVAGDPGVGKSRLLWEAMEQARASGFTVLASGCQRQGDHEPYAPLPGALRHFIHHQRPDRLREQLQRCAWLVRVLPELTDGPIPPLPAWSLRPEQEQHLMVEAVMRFLDNVSGSAGTLLLLDDLQWANSDALALIATLVRASPGTPRRFVGAYRESEVHRHSSLFAPLFDLASAGLAAYLPLGPLEPEEAAELLDTLLVGTEGATKTQRNQVLQRAGGVPFFLVSCAQGLRLDQEHKEAVPWDMTQSIRQRLAVLPSSAQELVNTAAVMGRLVPRTLLMRVSVRPEEEVLAAFDAACQARLLQETGEDAYQFVHDVIREVVDADLGTARRKVLHRRVAEALEQIPGSPLVDLLSFHYVRSDATERAIPYLELAGDDAESQCAHASAVAYYATLVELLDEVGGTEEVGRACEKLGVAMYRIGKYDAALPVLNRADEVYGALGDLEGRRRTVAQIGWLHAARGTRDQGIDDIEGALRTLHPDAPSPELAAIYVALGQLYSNRGRYGDCVTAIDRAVEIARAVGDSRALGTALAARSDFLVMGEQSDEALLVAEEAIRLNEQSGDLAALCSVYRAMIGAHSNNAEFAQALMAGDRAVEIAEQLGDPWVRSLVLSSRALCTLHTGDWDSARVDIEAALALGREIGPSEATGFALLLFGQYCLYTGEWDDATRYLNECVAMVAHGSQIPWAQSALAELDLRRGRPEQARDRLVSVLDHADPTGLETIWVAGIRPLLVRVYLELGDLARAEDLLASHLARVTQIGRRPLVMTARWLQAMVDIRRGRWAEAEQALEESLIMAHGMPHAGAYILETHGQLHTESNNSEQAREKLQAALTSFQQLGARKDVERVASALALLSPSIDTCGIVPAQVTGNPSGPHSPHLRRPRENTSTGESG